MSDEAAPTTQARMEAALADLAEEIVEKAGGPEVDLKDKVTAFKAIGVYYSMLRRLTPDEPGDEGFGKWTEERDAAEAQDS